VQPKLVKILWLQRLKHMNKSTQINNCFGVTVIFHKCEESFKEIFINQTLGTKHKISCEN